MADHSISKADQRVQRLKGLLENRERRHLVGFLHGVDPEEIPQYELVNGVITPPFTEVSLKDSAFSFDFGNVRFLNGDISHVVVSIAEDKPTYDVYAPLPHDWGNERTVPIPHAVVEELYASWVSKFEAVEELRKKINKQRNFARDMLGSEPYSVVHGKEGLKIINKTQSYELGFHHGIHASGLHSGTPKRRNEDNQIQSSHKRPRTGPSPSTQQIILNRYNDAADVLYPGIRHLIEATVQVVRTYQNTKHPSSRLDEDMKILRSSLYTVLPDNELLIMGSDKPEVQMTRSGTTQSRRSSTQSTGTVLATVGSGSKLPVSERESIRQPMEAVHEREVRQVTPKEKAAVLSTVIQGTKNSPISIRSSPDYGAKLPKPTKEDLSAPPAPPTISVLPRPSTISGSSIPSETISTGIQKSRFSQDTQMPNPKDSGVQNPMIRKAESRPYGKDSFIDLSFSDEDTNKVTSVRNPNSPSIHEKWRTKMFQNCGLPLEEGNRNRFRDIRSSGVFHRGTQAQEWSVQGGAGRSSLGSLKVPTAVHSFASDDKAQTGIKVEDVGDKRE